MKPLFLIGLCAVLAACGGGDDRSTPVSTATAYISFSGNENGGGYSVIDANNQAVKFLTSDGSMQTLAGGPTDIKVNASSYSLAKGSTIIGKVSLVKSSTGGSVSALIATNGTAFAVGSSNGISTLTNTNTVFAATGSGGSSIGGAGACTNLITGSSGSICRSYPAGVDVNTVCAGTSGKQSASCSSGYIGGCTLGSSGITDYYYNISTSSARSICSIIGGTSF
jgi:hypothetical protein